MSWRWKEGKQMQFRNLSPRRIGTCTFLTGAADAIDIRFLMVLLVALKDTKIRHHDCRHAGLPRGEHLRFPAWPWARSAEDAEPGRG
jgi:hypothetical protein